MNRQYCFNQGDSLYYCCYDHSSFLLVLFLLLLLLLFLLLLCYYYYYSYCFFYYSYYSSEDFFIVMFIINREMKNMSLRSIGANTFSRQSSLNALCVSLPSVIIAQVFSMPPFLDLPGISVASYKTTKSQALTRQHSLV
jgi:hypothetical protein